MTVNAISDPTAGRTRRRKVAAVLAGGLVLGVGTMATLASWNDSEFASGTFTAGQFALEGAADTGVFGEHPTGSPASLSVTTGFNNLSPTDVAYAPYALRLAATTTNSAEVAITAQSKTGDVTNLTYTLLKTDAWGCSSTTTGTELVPSQAVGSATGAVKFDLAVGTGTPSIAGAPVFLCFKVTAGSIVQNQTGTATWQFQATSKA